MTINCLILGLSGSIVPNIYHGIVDMACTEVRHNECLLRDADKIRLVTENLLAIT
jgi:hypothetical protein